MRVKAALPLSQANLAMATICPSAATYRTARVVMHAKSKMSQCVGAEMYSLLLETYIKDPVQKDHLFRAVDTIPCVAKKADWAIKWITR